MKWNSSKALKRKTSNKKVARAYTSLLSLIVEYFAINNFFNQFKESDHRCIGYATIEEAFKMAYDEFDLTAKEL